jgi:hypothetical protein
MEEDLKRWTVDNTTKVINQIKVSTSYFRNKYFKKGKGFLGKSTTIPIKKGAGLILTSVSPEADHLIVDGAEEFTITVEFPRFPLEKPIPASELNIMKAMDGTERAKTLAQTIGDILEEQRGHFDTTIEYMCVGAIFGKVMDGSGKVLFEFTSTREPIEFKTDKTIKDSTTEIDDVFADEFGTEVGYSVYCSRTFLTNLANKATAEKLFEQNQARYIEEDKKSVLVINGVKYLPYTAKYKDTKGDVKQFIADKEAVAVPDERTEEMFAIHYGRADHTDAVNKKPMLYFSALEKLPKGRGWSVLSETKPIPVNTRPNGTVILKWTGA